MLPWIRVSSPDLSFSAAHFITFDATTREAVHGHDYRVAVRLQGGLNREGLLVDFLWVQRTLRDLISGWDHRILLPGHHPQVRVVADDRMVEVVFGDSSWRFPAADCVVLPVENTTAEHLARLLAEAFRKRLHDCGFSIIAGELELSEAPGFSAGWSWKDQAPGDD